MDIALVTDVYEPQRSPEALRLRALALEFVRQGHPVTVLVASPGLADLWKIEETDGIRVGRLRTPRTEGVGAIRRFVSDFRMPFHMIKHLMKSPLIDAQWDGVVWSSPSVFMSPMAGWMCEESGCRSYLILNERHPDAALESGRMSPGLSSRFLKLVARQQYRAADTIGLRSPSDAVHFEAWLSAGRRRLETLPGGWADAVPPQAVLEATAQQIVAALSP